MAVIAWEGFPLSISILRANGIERKVVYHPTHKPLADNTLLDKFVTDHCGGIYLKWLNKKSGYDYWLFNPQYLESIRTRDLGRIINPDTDRPNAISSTHGIGKTAYKSIRLTSKADNDQMQTLQYVLVSPEVYIFNPESLTGTVTCAEWKKVFIKSGRFRTNTSKNNTQKLSFTVEFDQNNVQTIV